MEEKKIHISYRTVNSAAELNAADKGIFDAAHQAMSRAYAPYSNFKVGCALLLENGVVVTGNNQENIAYPSGLCAERVALFAASANYPKIPIKILVVVAQPMDQDHKMSITPCGSCRQVMVEYERIQKKPMRIITGAANGVLMIAESTKLLLPFAFFDGGLSKE